MNQCMLSPKHQKGSDTDLISMQIYKRFQFSSTEKCFMSMPQQIVQQLENQIKKTKESQGDKENQLLTN